MAKGYWRHLCEASRDRCSGWPLASHARAVRRAFERGVAKILEAFS